MSPTSDLPRSLSELLTLEYLLLGDLREMVEQPLDETDRRWLAALLEALHQMLPAEFEQKQSEGYLAEVLERFPNWARQVEDLHREHRRLYAALGRLRDAVDHVESLEAVADQVATELETWMNRFVAYHRHESRLMQDAMNLDIGGGD